MSEAASGSDLELTADNVPKLVTRTLVDEYGEDQERCVRGYFPSQSISKVMEYLDASQIQQVRATRTVKENSESFKIQGADLPSYVEAEEQMKKQVAVNFDRRKHKHFEWGRVLDYLASAGLEDMAIHKLVLRMEHEDLRDHLFTLLRQGINYPPSYKAEFTDPFYFVMESKPVQVRKDRQDVEDAHDTGELKRLGWRPRCLDLVAIWSHRGWTKSGNQPYANLTQHDVEELAFNQRESDQPVFGAVNTMLVVNRWRSAFGRGMTDVRPYEWRDDMREWVPEQ